MLRLYILISKNFALAKHIEKLKQSMWYLRFISVAFFHCANQGAFAHDKPKSPKKTCVTDRINALTKYTPDKCSN